MKEDLKETSLYKIIPFKSTLEKEKVLQILISGNNNHNKVVRIHANLNKHFDFNKTCF